MFSYLLFIRYLIKLYVRERERGGKREREETGSDVCICVVRQEDGTKIHQQRKESQETQAEDDGRSVSAGGGASPLTNQARRKTPVSLRRRALVRDRSEPLVLLLER